MENPLRIFLARHGETEWNRLGRFQGRTDIPLNEKGLIQVEAMALTLRSEPLVAVYSSPLRRAIQTAQAIMRHHPRAKLIVEDDLIEMNLGTFDGMEAERWLTLYPEFAARWRESPSKLRMPGGETLEEVQRRGLRALERITGRHSLGDTVAVCTHNFVAMTILCHALDMPLDQFREIRIRTGSISVLCYSKGILWADRIDDRTELPS